MNKILIMFAYSGYDKDSSREKHFWTLVKKAKKASEDKEPIVVLNVDTEAAGGAKTFLKDPRVKEFNLKILRCWSVDTCQMWLHGWGHILDKYPNAKRIVLLPGDIDMVVDPLQFYNKISGFIQLGGTSDIVIGDFDLGNKFGAKFLIDQYGTYPLLANWFPEFTRALFKLPLNRPRSEFLNIKSKTLRELLKLRKFAYEQTINLLLGAWDRNKKEWKYKVMTHSLGELKDDDSHRNYVGALNQIERAERLIKLRWREIYRDDDHEEMDFIRKLNYLNQLSNATKTSCGITLQTLLGIRGPLAENYN